MMLKVIRQATQEDIHEVVAFLMKAGLSIEGIKNSIDCFLVVEDSDNQLIGTLGIEAQEKIGLLRSLVVTSSFESEELFALFQEILKLAKEKELTRLYLISNRKASLNFFDLLGFQQENEPFVDELQKFVHAQKLSTVDNCITMRLDL
ncbi:GNAT family N-acetyltransferase [Rossellomorea aquimaris]|uniref:GNAT family N-acetyltransferase n=1 Tax=Rossellomorea aquimaris TaxID=189382 RepID=UPI003CEF7835